MVIFLLYWEVHNLMVVVVTVLKEDLYWFCEKRLFIDSGVYIRLNGAGGSKVAPCLPL